MSVEKSRLSVSHGSFYPTISAIMHHKSERRAHWHHLMVRHLDAFFYRFFFHLGILDDWYGFVIAVLGGTVRS